MPSRPLRLAAILSFAAAPACGPDVDLAKSIAVTDVFSGYYDNGVKDGKNHLLPSITFRLQNVGAESLANVQLMVSFWQEGADGELDSLQVPGIGSRQVSAGAATEPIQVRSTVGYTLEGARADFFMHSLFRDMTAKIFAKRSGKIVPVGEVKIDRRILPHLRDSTRP
jgi:hypothetical protein